MDMAVKLGKQTRPDMHLGICGEHGGESIFRRVLPQVRIRLCILLTIPCADRKISSSSGSYQQQIIRIFKSVIVIKKEAIASANNVREAVVFFDENIIDIICAAL